jgi:hypothetical protein
MAMPGSGAGSRSGYGLAGGLARGLWPGLGRGNVTTSGDCASEYWMGTTFREFIRAFWRSVVCCDEWRLRRPPHRSRGVFRANSGEGCLFCNRRLLCCLLVLLDLEE